MYSLDASVLIAFVFVHGIVCLIFDAGQKRCSFDGTICLGVPRGCLQQNETAECEAVVVLETSPASPGLARIILTGDGFRNDSESPDKWVAVNFSENGEIANTTGVQCMYHGNESTVQIIRSDHNDHVQPSWTGVDQSMVKTIGASTNSSTLSCTVDLPWRFTVNNSLVALNRMAYHVVSTGSMANDTQTTNTTDLYLISRVRPAWSADERTFPSYCTRNMTEDSEKGCDMAEYLAFAASQLSS